MYYSWDPCLILCQGIIIATLYDISLDFQAMYYCWDPCVTMLRGYSLPHYVRYLLVCHAKASPFLVRILVARMSRGDTTHSCWGYMTLLWKRIVHVHCHNFQHYMKRPPPSWHWAQRCNWHWVNSTIKRVVLMIFLLLSFFLLFKHAHVVLYSLLNEILTTSHK